MLHDKTTCGRDGGSGGGRRKDKGVSERETNDCGGKVRREKRGGLCFATCLPRDESRQQVAENRYPTHTTQRD